MSQSTLFDGLQQEKIVKTSGPVTCLGQTFASDEERRKHFTALLREKLQEPEFRKIEGFPHGEDEDILNLSDSPYYTACPNPWLGDFIAEWEAQKPTQPEGYHYHREPFAADVSEGKNDPIYNAHSYHTKVPHKAIMRYILHYTDPGDIVFDGFCGTGMTGVAAQMCGDKNVIMELGYQVKSDGTILQEEIDETGKKQWKAFSKLGVRRAVLNDLSPAATFIAYNYNTPIDTVVFEKEAKRILKKVEDECDWMYETKHSDGSVGKINYMVWSDVFICPECTHEVIFWEAAVDKEAGSVKAVTTPTAVKQDLVISAYKPNGGFEERFQQEAQTEEGVWDFVRTHLKYLPVTKRQGMSLQMVPERDPRILFDQMVAYFVRRGYSVPISSPEFQIGLAQRFIERDGMYLLPDQVAEYDRKKMSSGELQQTSYFVFDEASVIQWLRQLLKEKPQIFADITPQFMQQLGGWNKNEEQLDLRELLNQNFFCYDGKALVPEQIHAYLSTNWKELRNLPKDDKALVAKASDRWYLPDPNKAGDLEKLRERALLKEFEDYKQAGKKLKIFRLEAVRAGVKKCWQDRDYATIVAVADKIPNNVLEEDPKLLMWYDQAVTRLGAD